MHEARLWKPLKDNTLQCRLCSHFCLIRDGERGKCAVRENRGGTLYSLVYDRVAAINLDPEGKNPASLRARALAAATAAAIKELLDKQDTQST